MTDAPMHFGPNRFVLSVSSQFLPIGDFNHD